MESTSAPGARMTGSRLAPTQGLLLVLATVAVFWPLVAPGYWIFTVTAGLILAMSTLGLMVVVGWAREVSLAQAGLTGTAVYISGYVNRSEQGWGWPFLPSMVVAIIVVVGLSLLIALATARLSGIYIMVLTLALQVMLERTVFISGTLLGGVDTVTTPRPALFGVRLDSDLRYYWFCLAALGGVMLFLARLRKSRYGRSLLLVGVDRQAAASVGISPWRYKIFAFIVAGACAGVAGSLTAPLYGTPPSFVGYISLVSLFYLAIPILAGFRAISGVVGVAMLFVLIPQALEAQRISPLLLGGVGLVLGTLAGPTGISGLVLDKREARRRRREGSASGSIEAEPLPVDEVKEATPALAVEGR